MMKFSWQKTLRAIEIRPVTRPAFLFERRAQSHSVPDERRCGRRRRLKSSLWSNILAHRKPQIWGIKRPNNVGIEAGRNEVFEEPLKTKEKQPASCWPTGCSRWTVWD